MRIPDIATKIYDLLEPLDSATRKRVIQGALGLLGDPEVPATAATTSAALAFDDAPPTAAGASGRIKGPRAAAWMRKYGLTAQQLEQIFHLDGGKIEVIGSIPGKSMREQTLNAYLLAGVQQLLQGDEPRFSETGVVALCKQGGCHNAANHSNYRNALGNRVAGAKDAGYTLTAPGLEQAAAMIKQARSA